MSSRRNSSGKDKFLLSQERHSPQQEAVLKKIFGTEEITYPHLTGNNKNYLKFLIISGPRFGSNFLCSLLRSHPHIACYNELLHPRQCPFAYRFFPGPEDPGVNTLKREDPVGFLNTLVYRGYQPEFRAVGFKAHYAQFEDPLNARALEYFRENREFRIIHLIRKNLFAAFISLQLARITGQWSKTDPEFAGPLKHAGLPFFGEDTADPVPVTGITIRASDLEKYFQECESQRAEFHRVFSKHPCLDVYYEELLSDRVRAVRSVLDFLGAEFRPLLSMIAQQSVRPPREAVSNYAALKDHFSRTPWSQYFDDPEAGDATNSKKNHG